MTDAIDGHGAAPGEGWSGRWRGLARRAVNLLLPPACMACARPVAEDGALCPACWSTLSWIERPFCARLAIPFAYDLGPGALSAEAIADPPPFEAMRAVAVYGKTAGQVVQALKYGDRTELAEALAGMMARVAAELAEETTLVVPVPLHRARLWRRRFNQSALLAAGVARRLNLPAEMDVLHRVRATRHQVGLAARERQENVRGAFRVRPEDRPRLRGRRVLLVDDVYTTGATVKAATRALLRGGAEAVDVVVFARVVEGSA